MTDIQQAVAGASENQGEAGSEGGTNAQGNSELSIDQLLAEYVVDGTAQSGEQQVNDANASAVYGSTTGESTPEGQNGEPAKADPLLQLKPEEVNLVREYLKTQTKERTQNNIAEVVKQLVGDSEIPEKIARGFLLDTAESDPRFENAFADRNRNPNGWSQIMSAMRQELQKLVPSPVDPNATDSQNAMISAVHGSQTRPQTAEADTLKNLGSKSQMEFENMKQALREAELDAKGQI